MQVIRVVSAALMAVALSGTGAWAQSEVSGPKEVPPADFAGNQYVDSAGCAFVRAGIGGQVTWVPRLGRDRQPVCGLVPTASTGAVVAQPAVPEPDTTPAPDASETAGTATQTDEAPAATAAPVRTAAAPAAATTKAAAPKKRKSAAKRVKKEPPTGTRLVRTRSVGKAATYCADRTGKAQRYLLSDGRRVTQCAEKAEGEPVAYINGLAVPGLNVEHGAPRAADAKRAAKADQGDHRVVWSKGKLSPAGQAALERGKASKASAPKAARGARYVQIGAYAEPLNADRAIAALKAMGLPVATAREHVGRKPVRTVLAGPFADQSALASALATTRRNGYPDAFPRR